MAVKKVAVVMGGYSSEAEISKNSGSVVIEALSLGNFDPYAIYIHRDEWYHLDENGNKSAIDRADFSCQIGGEKVIPDVIFNTVHGTPGEDGFLQAYWELLGIPQTSASFYAAALSFNKRDSLSVLKNFGIKCANSYYINQGQPFDITEIVKKVGLPCFVKPNRAGSSFGISKVQTMDDMQTAIDKAFKEDREVLIETALVGTEVSVGVYQKQGEVFALPPTEIVSQNEFFDYEAKYKGQSEEITPARLSDDIIKKVQEEAVRIYKLLNMKGVSRSDFIVQKETPYFIEINSTPGLSSESIIPKQVRASNMTLTAFFELLIQEALALKTQ